MTSNDTEVEKEFENPLYTDVDIDCTSATINQHQVTRAQGSTIYEGIDTENATAEKKQLENPLYADIDLDPSSVPINQHQVTQDSTINLYERIDAEKTTATYEVINDGRLGAIDGIVSTTNGSEKEQDRNGAAAVIRGCSTTDPVVNDLPPDVASYPGSYEATPAAADVDSDNVYAYSELGVTYSQLEPHIPTIKQVVQDPPNEDEYSCLQHK